MTKKTVKENIDQNKFQPINTNNEYEALQGNNIARNEAMLNGEAQIKHHLSKYTDDKKRWLGTKADEEQSIYLFTFFAIYLKLTFIIYGKLPEKMYIYK